MTPRNSAIVVCVVLSLLSLAVVSGQKVQGCTRSEMDTLLLNQNVRGCAENYGNLLPAQGCEGGLADQACYCHSPGFMAAVTGCLFKEEPDVQEELLRCGKWYLCDTLGASLNSSNVELTPESTQLLAKGKDAAATISADSASPRHEPTMQEWTAFSTVFAAMGVAIVFVT